MLYQTEDGRQRIEVRLQDGSVWLTQKLLAELFAVGVNTINYHIKEIYKDGELQPEATIRKYRIVQTEGKRQIYREVDFYDIKMILAVGYRVRSHRGLQFRQWASERLQEYVVIGGLTGDIIAEELQDNLSSTQKEVSRIGITFITTALSTFYFSRSISLSTVNALFTATWYWYRPISR